MASVATLFHPTYIQRIFNVSSEVKLSTYRFVKAIGSYSCAKCMLPSPAAYTCPSDGFVQPPAITRSLPGWIGPIGDIKNVEFIPKPAYRYSLSLFLCVQCEGRDLLSVCPFVPVVEPTSPFPSLPPPPSPFPSPLSLNLNLNFVLCPLSLPLLGFTSYPRHLVPLSGQSDRVTCELYDLSVLHCPGPIPAELGQLANLEQLNLGYNMLTGTLLPLFPLTCVQFEGRDLLSICPIVPAG
jgi:hypothetical protein